MSVGKVAPLSIYQRECQTKRMYETGLGFETLMKLKLYKVLVDGRELRSEGCFKEP